MARGASAHLETLVPSAPRWPSANAVTNPVPVPLLKRRIQPHGPAKPGPSVTMETLVGTKGPAVPGISTGSPARDLPDGMASRDGNGSAAGPHPPVPGFVHCRRLGPWLRELYLLQPQLAAAVQDLSCRFAEMDAWGAVLHHVASRHKLPGPEGPELWPICGGDCVVFQLGRHVIKFFCNEDRNTAHASWQAEILACQALAGGPLPLQNHVPWLQAHGILPQSSLPEDLAMLGGPQPFHASNLNNSEEVDDRHSMPHRGNARRPSGLTPRGAWNESLALGLPYVITTLSEGESMAICRKQLPQRCMELVAEQLGTLVASIHAMPLPSPADVASVLDGGKSLGTAALTVKACQHADVSEGSADARVNTEVVHEELAANGDAFGMEGEKKCFWDGSTASGGIEPETGPQMAGSIVEPPKKRQCLHGVGCQEGMNINGWEPSSSPSLRDGLECGRCVCGPDSGQREEGMAQEVCTLWHDDNGHVWQYPSGSSEEGGGSQSQVSPEAEPGSGERASQLAETRPAAAGAATQYGPWEPFMTCLNRRREKLLSGLDDVGLPQRFVQEIRGLIAVDVRGLLAAPRRGVIEKSEEESGGSERERGGSIADVGQAEPQESSTCQSGALWKPSWLHGDLTSENVLVERPCRSQEVVRVNIIDFADGGHGDPLYDLVMLFLCVFEGKDNLAKAFMRTYLKAFGATEPAWMAPRGHVPLSRAALVYTILHEQDALPRMFKLFPHLWDAPSLDSIASAVWGWLDEVSKWRE
eukprot:jgi/Botrbrau1/21390/Bobra.0216s0010.1